MSTLALLLLLQFAAPAADAADKAVESGREALDKWWGYPWYDAQTDGVRRVEIRQPWNWPDMPRWLLETLFWIVVTLVAALLIYLLIRALLDRRRRSLAPHKPAPHGSYAGRVEALPFPLAPGRSDLLAEARQRYRQGDYGQAIIYLFSYQLVQLDKRQIIRLTKGKTNRQYLREVGGYVGLQHALEQTMLAFEDVFFGNHTLDRSRFESCWSRVGEFESLAKEGA